MRSKADSKLGIALILLVLPALWSSSAKAFDRVRDESVINAVSTVTVRYFLIQPQSSYLFWTSNLAPAPGGTSADPFMHVVAVIGLSGLTLSNDDCTQTSVTSYPNSCVLLDNPTSEYAYVEVLVHSYATSTAAVGTLNALGPGLNSSESGLEFGGQSLSEVTDEIGWGVSDRIHVVRPPNHLPAGVDYKLLVLGAPGASPCTHNAVKLLAVGGGPDGVQMPSASSGYCRAQVLIGATGGGIAGRSARLYINDAQNSDTDGDGLGDQLETELGTCPCQVYPGGCNTPSCAGACAPGVSPEACNFSLNAQDTDRDGLRDDWEVLGVSQLFLPRWGADPRHKDAFVELDWNSALVNPGAPVGANPMNPSIASIVAEPFQSAIGTGANNPDGLPGVNIHMDIGVDSCAAPNVSCCKVTGLNCSTLYGDWGGGKQIAGNDYITASSASMSTSRRGVFFYGLFARRNGGTASGWRFTAGDGRTPNSIAQVVAHEFGHCLGPQHWGDPDGIRSLICKPNYRSVMSYVIPGNTAPPFTFSAGTRPDLISTSLDERGGTGHDFQFLGTYFGLDTSPALGHVDWNRNGVIEPPDPSGNAFVSAVTAWSSLADGCLTGFLHVNEVNVGTLDTTRRPTLAVLTSPHEVLHGFQVAQGGTLRHRMFASDLVACTNDPAPSDPSGTPDFCCPTGSNNLNDCSGWSSVDSVVATGLDSSPAAARSLSTVNTESIVVAYVRPILGVRTLHIRRVLGFGTFGPEVPFPTLPVANLPSAKEADPAIVWVEGSSPNVSSSRRIHIFYLDTMRSVRQAVVRDNGSTFTLMSDSQISIAGVALKSLYSPGAFFDIATNKIVLATVRNDAGSRVIRFFTAVGQPGTAFSEEALPNLRTPWSDGPVSVSRSTEGLSQLEAFYPWSGGVRRMWARSGFEFNIDRDIFDTHANDRNGVAVATYRGKMQLGATCPSCAGGSHRFQHHPFASGIFPFVEEDVDDFGVFDDWMCGILKSAPGANAQLCVAPGGSTSALTGVIPVGECR